MPRITKAKISFISLVPRGANGLPTILKDDGSFELATLTKAGSDFELRGELLNVVYSPNLRDSQGDVADADVIKDMAYDFSRNGKGVDIRHDGQVLSKDKAYVAESFIVQKGDSRFADFKDYSGTVVDVTGAWATVIKIEDAGLKQLFKDGKWNGVSMGGVGTRVMEKAESDEGLLRKFLGWISGIKPGQQPPDGDVDMKPEEIAKIATDAVTAALKAHGVIKEAAASTAATITAPTAVAPVFKGDPLKIEDVKKHQKDVKVFNLQKSVKWDDDASVSAYLAEIAKLNTETTTTEPVKDTEVARLEKELAEAQKRSNQPLGKGAEGNPANSAGVVTGLSKEDSDAAMEGMRVANAVRKQRGQPVMASNTK